MVTPLATASSRNAVDIAAGIVGAVAGNIDGMAGRLEWRAGELRHGEYSIAPLIEVRSANERGASRSRSPKPLAVSASPISVQSITTCLRANAGPFDECHADAAGAAGADGVEHARIGDRRGIALALQLEFRGIDAARNVGGQHQQEIDIRRPRAAATGASAAPAKIETRRTPVARMFAPQSGSP